MSLHLPYNFKKQSNNYRFQTDKGIYYSVEFSEGSFYFSNFPNYLSVFEFSISVPTLGENFSPPLDHRVEATVVEILRAFFSNHKNSIVYTCESIDNRQKARQRKFDRWFNQNIQYVPELEKYDAVIKYDDLEIISALIVHINNPKKDELVNIFLNQIEEYRNK
jgi:Family of unknown function (DUF6169)